MSDSISDIKLSEEEFLTFLMIYVAHVDYIYSEDEITFIKDKSHPEIYDRMIALFLDNNDFSSMRIILKHKSEYFHTEKEKSEIFDLIKEIFEIDGDYSRIEKSFVTYFERIIES